MTEEEEREAIEELNWILKQFVAKYQRKPNNLAEFETFWNEIVKKPIEITFGIS